MSPAAEAEWLPLVWGRTQRADKWWRVCPAGLDQQRWLNGIVSAIFAGGAGLSKPRFVLARAHGWWIAGVGCAADELDPTMASDDIGRRFFTTVAWMTTAGEPDIPGLADLEANYQAWAGPTYSRWCAPVWSKHQSDILAVPEAVPQDAPWPLAEPPSLVLDPLGYSPGKTWLYPEADRYDVWDAGRRSTSEFLLVTGWTGTQMPEAPTLTHASVAQRASDRLRAIPVEHGERGPDLVPPTEPEADPAVGTGVSQPPIGVEIDDRPVRKSSRLLDRLLGDDSARRIDSLQQEVSDLRSEVERLRQFLELLYRQGVETQDDLAAVRRGLEAPIEPSPVEDQRVHDGDPD